MSWLKKLIGLPNGDLTDAQDRMDQAKIGTKNAVEAVNRATSSFAPKDQDAYRNLRDELDKLRLSHVDDRDSSRSDIVEEH